MGMGERRSTTALFALVGALSLDHMHAFAARMGSSALLPAFVKSAPSSLRKQPRLANTNGMAALASSFAAAPHRNGAGYWISPRASASRMAFSPPSPQTRWASSGGGLRVRGGGGPTAGAGSALAASTLDEAVAAPAAKFRKDYQAPGHWTRHITLDINLGAGTTVVTSELDLERNADRPGEDLFLDGEELKLFRVYVRGKDDSVIMLKEGSDYTLSEEGMLVKAAALPSAQKYTLGTTVQIAPEENRRLSGLCTPPSPHVM